MNPLEESSVEVSHRQQLVDFDEALRLGRHCDSELAGDPALRDTQDFLVYLQSVWQRKTKTIGKYTLIRNLGSGAIGPSYLVEDPQTKDKLVLRILWPDLNAQPATQKKILAEAKASQLLHQFNILNLRQARITGSVCMFVSAYNAGPSLAEWRSKHSAAIAWDAAVTVIANLADILEQAHAQGFTHGNLKPSNIFLLSDRAITPADIHQAPMCIGEFGLAKAVLQSRCRSVSGLPWPMPQYLAPEQLARGEMPADLASDLYALGVLLYELLTDRSPAVGATCEEILVQTRERLPTPPRKYRADIPEDVNDLVMKCLAKNPRQRHTSAKQFAEACRSLLPGAKEPRVAASWWKRWLPW